MDNIKLTARFLAALNFATLLHLDQERKGAGVPYVAHLLGVSSLVLEYGGTEDEAIAALLHDAVEDQGGKETRKKIAELFGEEIALIVDGCTDTDITPKPEWRLRKENYLAHLKQASQSVLLVSSCDKLYNARTILEDYRKYGDQIWERFKGGKVGSLWYYESLVSEYIETGSHPVFCELKRTVAEIERLVKLNNV